MQPEQVKAAMSQTITAVHFKHSRTAMQYDWLNAALSFALVVGAPILFWLSVLEWLMPTMGFSYGMPERLLVGGGLSVVLTTVWSIICSTSNTDN